MDWIEAGEGNMTLELKYVDWVETGEGKDILYE